MYLIYQGVRWEVVPGAESNHRHRDFQSPVRVETLREHTAQPLPKLTRHLGTVRGLFRQIETARNFEDRLKHSAL
jgi:hypothetical protein